MATQNFVRITVFIMRNPNLTSEEFHTHWSKVQGPLVTQLLLSKGFARYTQVHTLPTLATILAPFGGDKFDGWADFVAPRFEAFVGLFADPFYLEKIKPVEEYMLDVSATLVINAGFEEVFIADGKATELAK